MNLPRARIAFAFSTAATFAAVSALAQATASVGASTVSTATVANSTAANLAASSGSAALNTHGNPAGAIGAAQLGSTPSTVGTTVPTSTDPTTNTVNGVETIAVAGGSESIGMRRERLRAETAVGAGAFADSTVTSFALDPATGAGVIRTTERDARDQLGDQVAQNIDSGSGALSAAKAQAKQLDAQSRAEFDAAARDARDAERRLRQSLSAAQRASATDWEQARTALASDYEAYIQAVAQAQRIAAGGSSSSTTRTTIDRR
jgi:hypothetical protein